MPLRNIIKIFQTNKKLWNAQEFGYGIHSGKITRKRTEQELSFLHVTLLLDPIYVPIKYYQIISNSMGERLHKISVSGYINKESEIYFLHETALLVLIYASMKYCQNSSNH